MTTTQDLGDFEERLKFVAKALEYIYDDAISTLVDHFDIGKPRKALCARCLSPSQLEQWGAAFDPNAETISRKLKDQLAIILVEAAQVLRDSPHNPHSPYRYREYVSINGHISENIMNRIWPANESEQTDAPKRTALPIPPEKDDDLITFRVIGGELEKSLKARKRDISGAFYQVRREVEMNSYRLIFDTSLMGEKWEALPDEPWKVRNWDEKLAE